MTRLGARLHPIGGDRDVVELPSLASEQDSEGMEENALSWQRPVLFVTYNGAAEFPAAGADLGSRRVIL